MSTLLWTEISDVDDHIRYECLSEELTIGGIDNKLELLGADAETFPKVLQDAQKFFAQIRIGGSLREKAVEISARLPSAIMELKCADAFVNQNGAWWPRNVQTQGFQRAFVSDMKTLDLTGAVFILGARCETRSLVAALTRIGFARFSISEPNEKAGIAFVESLKRTYFNVEFSFVSRGMITQLPSVHSIAINTLERGHDDGALAELFYFNFLKPGGIWLDLPLAPVTSGLGPDLEAEARAVGSIVESGEKVIAWVDQTWARLCFKDACVFSRERYADNLKERRLASRPGPSNGPSQSTSG